MFFFMLYGTNDFVGNDNKRKKMSLHQNPVFRLNLISRHHLIIIML